MAGRCASQQTIVIPGENPFRINLTYFVDATYGNDATGEQDNPTKPFRTIAAPSAIAIPGSVIYVRPGTYSAGIIQLRQGVAWYFEEGVVLVDTQFQGNASSAIVGYATFNSSIPVLDYTGTGGVLFEIDGVNYSGPDYAFLIHGSGMVNIGVINMNGNGVRNFNSNVNVVFRVINQVGAGIIRFDTSSSGHSSVNVANSTNSGTSIIIQANQVDLTYEGQAAISTSDYFIDILDNPSALQSGINVNLSIDRLECLGLIRSIGIPGLSDPRLEPSLNLHISTIASENNSTTNPIIDLIYTFCNLAYNRLSFSYLVPIPFIIVCRDLTVLTVNGAQTLNSDQTLTADVGFLQTVATGQTFAIANMTLTELFLTSRVADAGANTIVYFNITNLTNLIPNNGTVSVSNTGRMGLFVRNALITSSGVSSIILNNGELFIESDSIEVQGSENIFVDNNSRMQTKIGRLASDGSDNTFVRANGLTGLNIGTITMASTGNLALSIENDRTLVNIGQINGSAQPGNRGVFVTGNSQIVGTIMAIRMFDNYCFFTQASGQMITNLKIGSAVVLNAATSVLYLNSVSNLILECDNLSAFLCTIPVDILNTGYNQLNFGRISIGTCDSGIRIAGGSRNTIMVNDFIVNNDATVAGIELVDATLTIGGNYSMSTTTASPIFLVRDVSAKLQADLGFISSSFYNLNASAFDNIWYSSRNSRVIDPSGSNVLVNLAAPAPNSITLDGSFFTNQSSNFIFIGGNNPGIVRLLNPYLYAPGATNIDASANPPLTIFCNYGVCNNGTSNTTEIPAGSLVAAAIA